MKKTKNSLIVNYFQMCGEGEERERKKSYARDNHLVAAKCLLILD